VKLKITEVVGYNTHTHGEGEREREEDRSPKQALDYKGYWMPKAKMKRPTTLSRFRIA